MDADSVRGIPCTFGADRHDYNDAAAFARTLFSVRICSAGQYIIGAVLNMA
jgi:hypothetical protein